MPLATPTTLSVSTRRGPITFTTQLEWAEAISTLRTLAGKGNEFAASLLEREDKNRYMSDAQINWVYKLAQDEIDSTTRVDELDEKVERLSTDASNILAALVEANVKGIKKPVLRLVTPDGAKIKVKYMTRGGNAGGAWITSNDELVGKINDQGEYTNMRGCMLNEFIASVNSNVQGAIVEYGRITSSCGCCGLPLTNSVSIALGIGPICLEKYGLGA